LRKEEGQEESKMTYEEARAQIIKVANNYLDSVGNTVESDVLLRVIAEEITRARDEDKDEDEGPCPNALWYDTSAELM
jgi:predicted Zn-dependent protease